MKSLVKYFISYSVFYFALRMWRRHFEFLPIIENNRMVIDILIFSIASLLLYINLQLKNQPHNKFHVHAYFVIFLVVTNIFYWNLYAYLMSPHLEYFNLLDPYLLGYFVLGLVGVSISFFSMKFLGKVYEKFRHGS